MVVAKCVAQVVRSQNKENKENKMARKNKMKRERALKAAKMQEIMKSRRKDKQKEKAVDGTERNIEKQLSEQRKAMESSLDLGETETYTIDSLEGAIMLTMRQKKKDMVSDLNQDTAGSNVCRQIIKRENGESSASPPPRDPLDIELGPGPSQTGASTSREKTYNARSAPTYEFTMPEHASASILKISDEKTLQLIDLYYNEECLWNTKSEDYKNKHRRTIATEKIAAIMDLPNFKAAHVIAKFKNLRDVYSQELKKVKHSMESDDMKVYTPRVFWWDKMNSFLGPHLQPRKEDSLTDEIQTLEFMEFDITRQNKPDTNLEPPADSRRRTCTAKRSRTEDMGKEKSIAQTLNDIQSNLQVLSSRDDDYTESFGKYVASLLRTLPAQKALALQPQIVSLITAELDEECPPEVPPPATTFVGIELKLEPDD